MNTELSNYILSVLYTQMAIIQSWGARDFEDITDGLAFTVNGFLFQGTVEIIYNHSTDLFSIFILKSGHRELKSTDISIFNLVDEIDKIVEKNCSQEEYEKQINAFYGIN